LGQLPQAPVARILPKIPMRADLIEYVEAYCRRQIALALLVDVLKQFRYRHALVVRNFSQVVPEGVFEAHACLVSVNYDRAFDNLRFHDGLPKNFVEDLVVIRCGDVGREVPSKKIVCAFTTPIGTTLPKTALNYRCLRGGFVRLEATIRF
jgi:hypothetical protein